MLQQSPEDYFRKSITVPFLYSTLNEMKTRFTDLHARTALGLQLVPSIIENITPIIWQKQKQKMTWFLLRNLCITNDHGYVSFVIIIISVHLFIHTRFVTLLSDTKVVYDTTKNVDSLGKVGG